MYHEISLLTFLLLVNYVTKQIIQYGYIIYMALSLNEPIINFSKFYQNDLLIRRVLYFENVKYTLVEFFHHVP